MISFLCLLYASQSDCFAVLDTQPLQLELTATPSLPPPHLRRAQGMNQCYWMAHLVINDLARIHATLLGFSKKQAKILQKEGLKIFVACANNKHEASLCQLYYRSDDLFQYASPQARKALCQKFYASSRIGAAPLMQTAHLDFNTFQSDVKKSKALQAYCDYHPSHPLLPSFLQNKAQHTKEQKAFERATYLPHVVYQLLAQHMAIDAFLTHIRQYYLGEEVPITTHPHTTTLNANIATTPPCVPSVTSHPHDPVAVTEETLSDLSDLLSDHDDHPPEEQPLLSQKHHVTSTPLPPLLKGHPMDPQKGTPAAIGALPSTLPRSQHLRHRIAHQGGDES